MTTQHDDILAYILAAGQLTLDREDGAAAALVASIALGETEGAYLFLRGLAHLLVESAAGIAFEFPCPSQDVGVPEAIDILRCELAGDSERSSLVAYLLARTAGYSPAFVNAATFLLLGIAVFVRDGRLPWPSVVAIVHRQNPERN